VDKFSGRLLITILQDYLNHCPSGSRRQLRLKSGKTTLVAQEIHHG